MAYQIAVCQGFVYSEIVGGTPLQFPTCELAWEFIEYIPPSASGDLTQADIGIISTSVLILFATAFAFRAIRRFMDSSSSGRFG